MVMNLGSAEIFEAIQQWVKTQGISVKHKTITIEVKSGRKGNGPSAVVTINPGEVPEPTEEHHGGHIPAISDDTFNLGDLS